MGASRYDFASCSGNPDGGSLAITFMFLDCCRLQRPRFVGDDAGSAIWRTRQVVAEGSRFVLRQVMSTVAATLALVAIDASSARALLVQTVVFDESGLAGDVPTVSGLYPVAASGGQPAVPVTTEPEFASGPLELGSPGPGPVEPSGATAAVLLLDPTTTTPSDLILFVSGLIVQAVHPYQINMISFYSAGAAACPNLITCIPGGVTPTTAVKASGAQDITALFAPTFDLGNIDNTIGYQIIVASPGFAVPKPASGGMLAAALAVLAGAGMIRRASPRGARALRRKLWDKTSSGTALVQTLVRAWLGQAG